MQEKFTIEWIEAMTAKTGTKYHKANLRLEDGTAYENVAIFKGFREEDLTEGATLTGELVRKEYNGKPSYTLNAVGAVPTYSSGASYKPRSGTFTPGGTKALMEKKEQGIRVSQDRKEESIRTAGAQRDSVLLVTTFYKDANMDEKDIKEKVVMFRDWFLSDDFTQTLPF